VHQILNHNAKNKYLHATTYKRPGNTHTGMAGDGRAVWHWGDNGVFKAFIAGYPDAGIGAVIMSNSENGAKVWRDVIVAAIGGTYPAIDWLNRLYKYA
jgi:hypothetical protein